MNDLMPLIAALLILALYLTIGLLVHYRRKYNESRAENERLNSMLDASVVRLDHAPPAGTPIVITWTTDFGEPSWQAHLDFSKPSWEQNMDWLREAEEKAAGDKYRRDTEERLLHYQREFCRTSGIPGF